jgi:hypothetical protein
VALGNAHHPLIEKVQDISLSSKNKIPVVDLKG